MTRLNMSQSTQKNNLLTYFAIVYSGCLLLTLITLEGLGLIRPSLRDSSPLEIIIFLTAIILINGLFSGLITFLLVRLPTRNSQNPIQDLDFQIQLDNAPLGVLIIGQNGEILYINSYITGLFGFSEKELLGQKVEMLIPDAYRSNHANQREQFNLKIGNRQMGTSLNLSAIHKNKTTFPVDIALSNIRTSNGIITLCYIQDITERKFNESLLKESEAKYRTLYQNGLVGIFRASYPGGCIEEANQAFLSMFGYKVIVALPLKNLFTSQEDYQHILSLLEERGDFHDFNIRCQRMDGTAFWASMSAMLFSEKGFIEIVFIDVDQRVNTEKELANSYSLLQATLESSNEGIMAVDRKLNSVYNNLHFLTLWNLDQEELDSAASDLLIHKMADQLDDPESFRSRISDIYSRPEVESIDIAKLLDGRIFELSSKPQRIGDEIVGRVWITRDITQRTQSEMKLQNALLETRQASSSLEKMVNELEKRAQETSLLNEMGDLLQICNTMEEAYAIINRYTPKLFPHVSGILGILSTSRKSVEVVVSWKDPSVIDLVFPSSTCWALRRARLHSEDGHQAVNLCQHMKKPNAIPYLCIPMLAHGELLGLVHIQYQNKSSSNNISGHDYDLLEKSNISLAVSLAERVSLALSNLRLRETLREQAVRDPLTGLFNRRFMQESLEREVRRAIRSSTPLSAILFDIDHFKQFNDTHGHEAGDLLLLEAGKLLTRSVRSEDIICRYGGEEFAIIMPGSNLPDAVKRAEQIREKINNLEIPYEGQILSKISISLGVASLSKRKPDGGALLHQADDAMYQAKAAGRNQVIFMKEDE